MTVSDWTSLGGLLLGILSLLAGFFMWYRGAVEKSYAAQRDFGHIRRNQEQMLSAIDQLESEWDDRLQAQQAELKEIKAYVFSLSQRFEVILARLDANSGIFASRKKDSLD